MTRSVPITVVILTFNEATNLAACLDSLQGVSDDIHVVDSGSDDGTVQLAASRGVHVHHHPFSGFGSQRNWAIDHVPHRYPWAFHLDADEQFTPQLAAEIAQRLADQPHEAGFYVPHKLMLCGRWLKHAGGYPVYQVRLFHHQRLRFTDHGHGQRELTDGQLGYLDQPYLHHAFSKGLDDWFAKHARYARLEAQQYGQQHRIPNQSDHTRLDGSGDRDDWRAVFGRDPIGRRRVLKRWSYRLPMRPTFRLLHVLIVQRGLLDGRAGWVFARMMATYESMISVHLGLQRATEPPADRPGC